MNYLKNVPLRQLNKGDLSVLETMSREELVRIIGWLNKERIQLLKDHNWRNRGMRIFFAKNPYAWDDWHDYVQIRYPNPKKDDQS